MLVKLRGVSFYGKAPGDQTLVLPLRCGLLSKGKVSSCAGQGITLKCWFVHTCHEKINKRAWPVNSVGFKAALIKPSRTGWETVAIVHCWPLAGLEFLTVSWPKPNTKLRQLLLCYGSYPLHHLGWKLSVSPDWCS